MALLLFVAAASALKNNVCFDMTPYNKHDVQTKYETTTCTICVKSSKGVKGCKTGVHKETKSGFQNCIAMDGDINPPDDIWITTDCEDDAMWIDRVRVAWADESEKLWGANDNRGLCLSRDSTDDDKFTGDFNVFLNHCYNAMVLRYTWGIAYGTNYVPERRLETLRRLSGADEALLAKLDEEIDDMKATWVEVDLHAIEEGESDQMVPPELP